MQKRIEEDVVVKVTLFISEADTTQCSNKRFINRDERDERISKRFFADVTQVFRTKWCVIDTRDVSKLDDDITGP